MPRKEERARRVDILMPCITEAEVRDVQRRLCQSRKTRKVSSSAAVSAASSIGLVARLRSKVRSNASCQDAISSGEKSRSTILAITACSTIILVLSCWIARRRSSSIADER